MNVRWVGAPGCLRAHCFELALPLSATMTSQSSPPPRTPTLPPPAQQKPTSLIAPRNEKGALPPSYCHLHLISPWPRSRGKNPAEPAVAPSSGARPFLLTRACHSYVLPYFLVIGSFHWRAGDWRFSWGVKCHSAVCTLCLRTGRGRLLLEHNLSGDPSLWCMRVLLGRWLSEINEF